MEQQRIIYILNFLSSNTSKNKQVTLREIQEHLATHEDIKPPSIITLRRDIDRLQTMGYNIKVSNGKHNTAYYYLEKKG
ncbi:MAG: WYL domain-containing transcriptional regulator, partial [Oscillospiraceae bacterium]|nr:WYL domain-containing transcriptional regulator [Oscillospiraceae bacterium]